jgi:hypothetical protein
VNRIAHAPVVCTEGDRSHKGRRREPAGATQMRRRNALDRRGVKLVSASTAYGTVMDCDFSPAGITNWNGRELRQGGSAKRTGGGKNGAANCIQRTSENAYDRTPTGCFR